MAVESIHRAVIFDLDGVLIDSEPLWRRAEIATFGEVGVALSDADCLETTGLRIDEAVDYWFERMPWTGRSCEDVARSIVSRVALLIRDEGEPMSGAVSSIEAAIQSEWRLAVASSSPKVLIETVLDRFRIADRFECTRSAEDEAFGKPRPDVYLSAAAALQLSPQACVAVEDSANGLASALAAGMRCIVVPPTESQDDPRFDAATLRIDSLHDLPGALDQLKAGPRSGRL